VFREAEQRLFRFRDDPRIGRFAKRLPQGFVGKLGAISEEYTLEGYLIHVPSPVFNAVYLSAIRGSVRARLWRALAAAFGVAARTDGVLGKGHDDYTAGLMTNLGFRYEGKVSTKFLTDNFKSTSKSSVDWEDIMKAYRKKTFVEIPVKRRLGLGSFKGEDAEVAKQRLGDVKEYKKKVSMGSARRIYVDKEPKVVGDLLEHGFEVRAPDVKELPKLLLRRVAMREEQWDETLMELGNRPLYLD
jgi:hypothetical protein